MRTPPGHSFGLPFGLPIALALTFTLGGCSGKDGGLSEGMSSATSSGGDETTAATSTSTSTSTSGAATSAAATTADPSAGSSTGSPFIVPPDMGPGVALCDPGLQDCPEGEKCTPYVAEPGACCVDSTKCTPVTGNKQFGETCTRMDDSDDCDVGFFCMTMMSGGTGEGTCLPLCSVDNPDTCPGGECIGFNDGFLPLCEVACDPLVQDCIGDNVGCYAVLGNDKFVCATSGYMDGKGNDGDECYTIQSCLPGLVCIDGTVQEGCLTQRCCTPVCDLTGNGAECTSPGESCTSPWAQGEAPIQYEDVGLCVIPG
ncbi:MAG: hypothetical protein H6710_14730 [Myxococcales bacterium]|nr:hypothetical protein [Myxococcales bacterium]